MALLNVAQQLVFKPPSKVRLCYFKILRFKMILGYESWRQRCTPATLMLKAIMKTLVERIYVVLAFMQRILMKEKQRIIKDHVELRWIMKTLRFQEINNSDSWEGLENYSGKLLEGIVEFFILKEGLRKVIQKLGYIEARVRFQQVLDVFHPRSKSCDSAKLPLSQLFYHEI